MVLRLANPGHNQSLCPPQSLYSMYLPPPLACSFPSSSSSSSLEIGPPPAHFPLSSTLSSLFPLSSPITRDIALEEDKFISSSVRPPLSPPRSAAPPRGDGARFRRGGRLLRLRVRVAE